MSVWNNIAFVLFLAVPRRIAPDGIAAIATIAWMIAAFRVFWPRIRRPIGAPEFDEPRWILVKQAWRLMIVSELIACGFRTADFVEPLFRFNPVEKADFRSVEIFVQTYAMAVSPLAFDILLGSLVFACLDFTNAMMSLKRELSQANIRSCLLHSSR